MLSLDRTAVCRLGAPALGVPIFEIGYRGAEPAAAPTADLDRDPLSDAIVSALWREITRLDAQLQAQAARIAWLETPWWRRTWIRLSTWWMKQIDG